jgi:hypothetical protein
MRTSFGGLAQHSGGTEGCDTKMRQMRHPIAASAALEPGNVQLT